MSNRRDQLGNSTTQTLREQIQTLQQQVQIQKEQALTAKKTCNATSDKLASITRERDLLQESSNERLIERETVRGDKGRGFTWLMK